ncbi:hypothetical protein CHLRE_17g696550v5 [Chlamydomonas reinhardtii]|uniref:Uncharacterized protein n=1 Tax=Chlamydomonas reinhardtii TaxID=3055 RepID=A0A2K3CNM3_CHLRE|nr:uncharacterized protein CHLRE_17g696550v5 [Chlamydomonas reinhardtii]PNW69880.1 hypothetical protein CHLRE_17g696550v5 [Chlamydomonas reinhardtii]7PKQ_h Chain h, uS8m [Chlamydomonas reinhardtii]
MAAPLLDPLVSKLRQTTATAARAAEVMRAAFPGATHETAGRNTIAVQLPRKDVPTYVMANQRPQPWELLPMKAAAMTQYPNFFNNSCTFFGSIKRDVVNGVPFCLLRPSRLALDMAKVVRNLGIVDGFEVVQRRSRLGAHDFVWLPEQQPQEPEHLYDTSLFRQRLIRLHLRTDLFSRLPGAPGSGAGGPQPASAQLAPAVGLLPLSVKNISKASQPVLMYPRQLEEAAARLPAGVFMCYHPQLGLITDAMAQQYDVPALVAAHVGLPLSQAAAIRGALRVKAAEEAGKELRHVTQLKDWNMMELLRQRMVERRAALEAGMGVGGEVAARLQELREAGLRLRDEASDRVTSALNVAQDLEDGALAWQLVHSRALGAAPGAAAAGVDEGAGGEEQAGAGEGRTSPRGQPRRRR